MLRARPKFVRPFLCAVLCTLSTVSTLSHAVDIAPNTAASTGMVIVDPQTIHAKAWLIMDGDSGQILGQSNAHMQHPPASLTKMMVAYLTLQQIQAGKLHYNDILTVPANIGQLVANDESRMRLKPNEQLSVQELMTGLLVTSANDAAVTLATKISGNIPAFVDLMNSTAHQLGMSETHYANPDGISQDGHYTTAYDLAVLSRAIIQAYPHYTDFSRIQHFSHGTYSERATNGLLKLDSSVDGMKTGYTKAAGFNIVISAKRPQVGLSQERRVFVVVLGSLSAAERVRSSGVLLNDAFEQTQNVQLLTANQPLARFKIWEGVQHELTVNAPYSVFTTVPNPSYHPPASLLPATPNTDPAAMASQPVQALKTSTALTSTHPVSYQLNLVNSPVIAPLNSQQTLGTLKISYNNQPITSIDLHPQANVQEAGFFQRLWDKVTLWYAQLRHTIGQPEKLVPTSQV